MVTNALAYYGRKKFYVLGPWLPLNYKSKFICQKTWVLVL